MTLTNGALARLGRAEKDVERIDRTASDLRDRTVTTEQQVNSLKDDITDLRDELKSIRRALWGAAGTFLMLALMIAQFAAQ